MQIKDLTPNADNPRTTTDQSEEALKGALYEFGDLGGIVYNRKSKSLCTGHQRVKTFLPNTPVNITKTYEKATRTGTVAEGFISHAGEKFRYREVVWDKKKEKAAMIAANNHAGKWDEEKLGEWLGELKDEKFDMSLTMFDDDELDAFMPGLDEEPVKKISKGKSQIMHECPKCGHEFN